MINMSWLASLLLIIILDLDRDNEAPIDVSYKTPLKMGYCSIDDIGNNGKKHAHCRCKNTKEYECRKKCDIDSNCKGYSYRNITAMCYLYTTSSCNPQCGTRNKGYTGDLVEFDDQNESGCFIKHLSMIIVTNHFCNKFLSTQFIFHLTFY